MTNDILNPSIFQSYLVKLYIIFDPEQSLTFSSSALLLQKLLHADPRASQLVLMEILFSQVIRIKVAKTLIS